MKKPMQNAYQRRKDKKLHGRHVQLVFCETVRDLDPTPAEGQLLWAMAVDFLKDENIIGLQGDPEEN